MSLRVLPDRPSAPAPIFDEKEISIRDRIKNEIKEIAIWLKELRDRIHTQRIMCSEDIFYMEVEGIADDDKYEILEEMIKEYKKLCRRMRILHENWIKYEK